MEHNVFQWNSIEIIYFSEDCLDGSDEQDEIDYTSPEGFPNLFNCLITPAFGCEEKICPKRLLFSCGDGECFSYSTYFFSNN